MSAIDVGLLSPVTVGHDQIVSDAAVLDALVTVEVALTRAYGGLGAAPTGVVADVSDAFGWADASCSVHGIDGAALAAASAAGGNPVIPLVALLKARVPAEARLWVHRGATSQDILDSALMLIASRAAAQILGELRQIERGLGSFAHAQRSKVAAARTLTQHAVPTTIGVRAAGWLRGVDRASRRLDAAAHALPAQLGGAGGTLASFVEIVGAPDAARLPALLAEQLGLATPDAPWHTTRWPVTELGDALVQSIDALGKIATDIATLSRTEIGEITEGVGGGSSAMPQKQNPAASVLIRSAALRAPALGSTLHLASALAVDERPDGAWHAEWPTLRELLRLALGASATAAHLIDGVTVEEAAVARNLALTRGLIVSERLSLVLVPLIGKARFDALIGEASAGADLQQLLRALPEASHLDVDALLDPAGYVGLADELVDSALTASAAEGNPQ